MPRKSKHSQASAPVAATPRAHGRSSRAVEPPAVGTVEGRDPNDPRVAQAMAALENARNHPAGNASVLPERDEKGQLTRNAMVKIVQGGGSFFHKGLLVTSLAAIPTEAALAVGDERAESAARESIAARRKQLDAEEQTLNTARPSAKDKKPRAHTQTQPISPVGDGSEPPATEEEAEQRRAKAREDFAEGASGE